MNETMIAARLVGRKVIAAALKAGATRIDVDYGDGPETPSPQDEKTVLQAMQEADEARVEFCGADGKRLGWMLWIAGNGLDALGNYGVNPWTEKTLDRVIEEINDAIMLD